LKRRAESWKTCLGLGWVGCESPFKTAMGVGVGAEEDFGQHMLPQSEANEARPAK